MCKRKFYSAGIVCLVLAAAIVANLLVAPGGFVNTIATLNEKAKDDYRLYYQIDFPVPKNSLRLGTVYLPLYSYREKDCITPFLASLFMENAEITELDEYFEAHTSHEILRIYKFIDLLEYESTEKSAAGKPINKDTAVAIAKAFMEGFLPHSKPYDTETVHNEDEIIITFTQSLSNIPNRAFPTQITMDTHGNITKATHFFFDYEPLGTTDIITVRSALAQLPRNHEGKIRLHGFELIYAFEDSILMPFYCFHGQLPCGSDIEYHVMALKFY